MKVCHFTSAHPSDDIRVFVKECSSLADAGHEVYLVAKGDSRIEKTDQNVQVCKDGISKSKSVGLRRVSFS